MMSSSKFNSSFLELRKTQEEVAANYALQVALQTMKERCQQLQARLSIVEEENLQLKIEKQRQLRQENKINTPNNYDLDKLQEQVAQLNREKSQLTHHIYMVASENKHLWTRLSLLTEANESLGTRLNKISTALNSHSSRAEQVLPEVNLDEYQSLEEISLKLINNIQLEKSELEQQCVDMVELQSFKDCDFTLTSTKNCKYRYDSKISEDEITDDLFSTDLEERNQQMTKFYLILKHQKEMLDRSVDLLKLFATGKLHCLVCKNYADEVKKVYCDAQIMTLPCDIINKSSVDEKVQIINKNSEVKCILKSEQRICPMCNCIFSSIHENVFVEHVCSHFPFSIQIVNDKDQVFGQHFQSFV